ncbi:MAG: hypothetical protein JJU28_00125 [Cyclobacteriaceae bacterium]|nr:hypothetical protein [Cyclobacteriaceae bacterium]
MKAIEFKSRIRDNQIEIPKNAQSELKIEELQDVRVILLIDETESTDHVKFRETAKEQFLKGYADSDSIYDIE